MKSRDSKLECHQGIGMSILSGGGGAGISMPENRES